MSEDNEVAEKPDLDQLTSIYLKIRDKRADIKREFDNADKDLEAQQKMLAEQMLDSCKEIGADSIKTPHGTIIRSVKSKYWTGDWDSMYNFIKEHDAFGLLEKRLHQTNMKDFLNENPDVMPMGLNVENEYTVVVRRAKS
jgi:hypothetical protein